MRGSLGTALLVAAVGLVFGSATARADRLTKAPIIAPAPSLSSKIKDRLEVLSEEVDGHLSEISFDMLSLHYDAGSNTAKIDVDAGDDEALGLSINSHVAFDHGAAKVKAHLDLGVAGRRLSFDLPEVDMVPRSFGGKRYVELQLPLVQGNF